jgi:hypothetical protein
VVLNDLGELRNHICIIPGKSDWIYGICPLAAIVFIVQSKEGSRAFIPVGDVCEGLFDDIRCKEGLPRRTSASHAVSSMTIAVFWLL